MGFLTGIYEFTGVCFNAGIDCVINERRMIESNNMTTKPIKLVDIKNYSL